MLETFKNLFKTNKEKEEDIVKTMSDVYNERIKIYEAWRTALNKLIDENRCEGELHPPKGRVLPDSLTSLA